MEMKIHTDNNVFEQIKEGKTRKAYQRSWQDPVVEVDVEVEEAQEVGKEMKEEVKNEMEEYIVLEEDPELYAMAGIEIVPVPAAVPVQAIESTIRQAMASVPLASGTTVNFRIIQNYGHVSNCTF